jgi:hypothetical protein
MMEQMKIILCKGLGKYYIKNIDDANLAKKNNED